MGDRCTFLQDEVSCGYCDDFCNMPEQQMDVVVMEGVPAYVERLDAFFHFAH